MLYKTVLRYLMVFAIGLFIGFMATRSFTKSPDLNSDGAVNALDLSIMTKNWGK